MRLEAVYLGTNARNAFADLVERIDDAGVAIFDLKEGVLERVGATVTPQPVLAVAPFPRRTVDELPDDGLVLVAVSVQDPGNAGTLLRSTEAFGGAGVVFCGNSVDVRNPKVVRSSAGAIFGLTIAEGDDPVQVLAAVGTRGRRRFGTAADGGAPPDGVDLTGQVALVLGNEARGLPPALSDELDATVTIPVEPPSESLNVAMAGTILLAEAARQRRPRARP